MRCIIEKACACMQNMHRFYVFSIRFREAFWPLAESSRACAPVQRSPACHAHQISDVQSYRYMQVLPCVRRMCALFSTVQIMYIFDRGRSSMLSCPHTQNRDHACEWERRQSFCNAGCMPRGTIALCQWGWAQGNRREDGHVRVAAHGTRPC